MVIGCDDAERRVNSTNPTKPIISTAVFSSAERRIGKRVSQAPARYFRRIHSAGSLAAVCKVVHTHHRRLHAGNKTVPFEMDWWGQCHREPRPGSSDSSPGVSPRHMVKTSTLICFRGTFFRHLVREYVEDDTDFLVNLTNDGWFGEGAEQWQHAAKRGFSRRGKRPAARALLQQRPDLLD